ncbi:hypothetical protein ABW20_dc0108952 [Dactylellina cionopaga]|nr:hypothetical protein ABW20_dc0108952 [Dactylellina cionopaga]
MSKSNMLYIIVSIIVFLSSRVYAYNRHGCNAFPRIVQPVDVLNVTNRLPAPGAKLMNIVIGVGKQYYICRDLSTVPEFSAAEAQLFATDRILTIDTPSLHLFPQALLGIPTFEFRGNCANGIFYGNPKDKIPAPRYTGAGQNLQAIPWGVHHQPTAARAR